MASDLNKDHDLSRRDTILLCCVALDVNNVVDPPRRVAIFFGFDVNNLNNVEYPSRGDQILMSSIAVELK